MQKSFPHPRTWQHNRSWWASGAEMARYSDLHFTGSCGTSRGRLVGRHKKSAIDRSTERTYALQKIHQVFMQSSFNNLLHAAEAQSRMQLPCLPLDLARVAVAEQLE